MKSKKPISFEELGESDDKPADAVEASKRLHESMESSRAELLDDQEFAANLLAQCIDAPDAFVREIKGETSAADRKVERHSLRGRTVKLKLVIYVSPDQHEQLKSVARLRGDRGPSDTVNQLVCTALKGMRSV